MFLFYNAPERLSTNSLYKSRILLCAGQHSFPVGHQQLHTVFLYLDGNALPCLSGQQQTRQRVRHTFGDLIADSPRAALAIDHAEPPFSLCRPREPCAARFTALRKFVQLLRRYGRTIARRQVGKHNQIVQPSRQLRL